MGVDELRARARASDPILWVFLGDSITHGALHTFGWRDYTEIFAERVRFELGRQGDLVLNAAYSGYTAPRLASELDHRCLRFRPQVVSIMIGTNDAKAGPAGLTEFETTLTDMVRRVQTEIGAHIILQTPPPIDTRNAPERESLPRYAEAMRRFVSAAASVGMPAAPEAAPAPPAAPGGVAGGATPSATPVAAPGAPAAPGVPPYTPPGSTQAPG